MKLYRFYVAGETDYVAAPTQERAMEIYMNEYGLAAGDMFDVGCSEADPESVECYPDDWDYEDDEAEPPSAAQFMSKPGLVCTTRT